MQGKENINSILIGYSVSLELVLCKYITIYLARGTVAFGCVPKPSMNVESGVLLPTSFAGQHQAPSCPHLALLRVGLKAMS